MQKARTLIKSKTDNLYKDHQYEYPDDLDLHPQSDDSLRLSSDIYEFAQSSRNYMQSRYPTWRKIDKALRLYVEQTEEQKDQDKEANKEKIVIPMTYAIYDVLMTYMSMAFLELPIFRYEGVDKFDSPRAKVLQEVIDKHVRNNKVPLSLMTMFADGIKYGIGPVYTNWDIKKRRGYKKKLKEETSELTGETIQVPEYNETDIIIESNDLTNIDPYQYLPDPNVPVDKIQNGQFVGWIERTNRLSLMKEEQLNDDIFNCKYLSSVDSKSQLYMEGKNYSDTSEPDATIADLNDDVVDVVNMMMEIIPSEVGLGDSDEVEKWFFRLAGDCVIIQAKKLDLNHNKYPIAVNAPEFDGYSASPISRLEMVSGIQDLVNWLIEARIANVKTAVNNVIVADPYLVNIRDLTKPSYGKVVRMRRAAYGKAPIRNAIDQLNIQDVTQSHLTDIKIMENMAKYSTGATDIMQGIIDRKGSRVSASESQGAFHNAASRLERSAMVTSFMAMRDIAYFFASHTQQFMDEEDVIRVVGDLEEFYPSSETVKVDSKSILCEFDIKVGDGTIMDKSNVGNWVQVFQAISQNPNLQAYYNIGEISKYIFKMMGAKNIDSFINKENIQNIQPTEDVLGRAERGEVTPRRQA